MVFEARYLAALTILSGQETVNLKVLSLLSWIQSTPDNIYRLKRMVLIANQLTVGSAAKADLGNSGDKFESGKDKCHLPVGSEFNRRRDQLQMWSPVSRTTIFVIDSLR